MWWGLIVGIHDVSLQILQLQTVLVGASLPAWVIVVVKGCSCDALHVDAHCLRFFKDALQAVDEVFMVIVALIDVKDC